MKKECMDKSEAINAFYNNYVETVYPMLEEFEKKRRKKLFIIISLFIVVPIVSYFLFPLLGSFVIAVGCLGLFFPLVMTIRGFVKELKTECMPCLIKAFGKMKWSSEKQIIRDYDLRESELFGDYNTRVDDDSFVGKYKGVEYKVSEINLAYVTQGRRRLYWRVFNGVVITFTSNKEIKNKTIITTKGDLNVRNRNGILYAFLLLAMIQLGIGVIGTNPKHLFSTMFYTFGGFLIFALVVLGVGLLVRFFCSRNKDVLREIKLEDAKFNKKYKAYSSDEVEGRYLITPAFMERFQTLHTSFGTRMAKCSFYDDKVMFSISTEKNLFELGSFFFPVNNQKAINRFLKEISAIFDLIDYFKLDEKTGL